MSTHAEYGRRSTPTHEVTIDPRGEAGVTCCGQPKPRWEDYDGHDFAVMPEVFHRSAGSIV